MTPDQIIEKMTPEQKKMARNNLGDALDIISEFMPDVSYATLFNVTCAVIERLQEIVMEKTLAQFHTSQYDSETQMVARLAKSYQSLNSNLSWSECIRLAEEKAQRDKFKTMGETDQVGRFRPPEKSLVFRLPISLLPLRFGLDILDKSSRIHPQEYI